MSKTAALLALGALAATVSLAQPAVMVKDVGTVISDHPPFSPDKPVLNGIAYFIGWDGVHGRELWRTNGTAAGTWMVRDLCPGLCPGVLTYGLTAWNGRIYFVGEDGTTGGELFASDGTAPGTQIVRDIRLGRRWSVESEIVAGVDRLYFSAAGESTGTELWSSQGTESTTQLVADIHPTGNSSPGHYFVLGATLIFQADDGTHGSELWRSDGTAPGTFLLADTEPGPGGISTNPYQGLSEVAFAPKRAVLGGQLLLIARSTSGESIWRTDGTVVGTEEIHASTNPIQSITVRGGTCYFTEMTSGLWQTDGSVGGATLIVPGEFSGVVGIATGLLLFGVDALGAEPWFSDGTPTGTARIADLVPGADGSALFRFRPSVAGDFAFFWARTAGNGMTLWRTDGTGVGTALVLDLPPNSASLAIFYGPPVLRPFGSNYLFLARSDDEGLGGNLMLTDGTAAGTSIVASTSTQTSVELVSPFYYFPGFRTDSPTGSGTGAFFRQATLTGSRPWFSDGTDQGTVPLADEAPGAEWRPLLATGVSDRGLFSFYDGAYSLWGTSGLPGSLELLANDVSYTVGPVGGHRYFNKGDDLWRTDGSPAGTALVEALTGGLLGTADDALYLVRGPSPGDFRRWRQADGSVTLGSGLGSALFVSSLAGRHIALFNQSGSADVREIVGGSTVLVTTVPSRIDAPLQATPFGIFFGISDAAGTELWITDGTAPGTDRVADIWPGPRSSEPEFFVSTTTALFFVADDGVHGRELWTSDGTEAGTRMVKDLLPGPGSGLPDQLYVADGLLIFAATDGVHGKELWVSNGTEAGTLQVQDIAPDGASSTPQQFTVGKDQLFFLANDTVHGFELWRVARTDLAALVTTPAAFFTLAPCRLYDSRDGSGPLTGGGQRSLAAHGSCGIPEGARSVAANVTAVGPTASGSLFIGANDGVQSLLEIPLVGGKTRATQALLRLSTTGDGTLRATANFPSAGSAGSVDWVLDIVGYFE